MEEPILEGVGNEVILVIVALVLFGMSCYLIWYILIKRSGHNIHPERVPAVQSTRREMGVAGGERVDGPPENCPVCLGPIEHHVETNCGHHFCAQCVLEYWRHDQWPRPARCPVCRRTVTLLLGTISPGASEGLGDQVLDYNQRMSGEWRPLLHYLYDVPTLLSHLWRELFSDRGPMLVRRLYLGYIFVLLFFYLLSPFDIIPESVFGLFGFIDDFIILFIVIIYISYLYRSVITQRMHHQL